MLPSSAGCECQVPPDTSRYQSGLLRPSVSLLYHWSPFYQQFGHHQHTQWYHPQYLNQQHYEQYDFSASDKIRFTVENPETEEIPKQSSLDYVTSISGTPESSKSRRNSAGMIEEYKVRGRRKYDTKYSFKQFGVRKSRSRQSEEIAQEFKRLGIGFCFQGIRPHL